jgi:hypothetical protein
MANFFLNFTVFLILSRCIEEMVKVVAIFGKSKVIDLGRVARVFVVQRTKRENIYQMATKYTKWLQNIPNGFKIYQMGETLVL